MILRTSMNATAVTLSLALLIIIAMLLAIVFEKNPRSYVEAPVAPVATVTPLASVTIDRYIPTSPSEPLTTYFNENPRDPNVSNVIGYFASGAFHTYVPEWLVQHWGSGGSNDGLLTTFYPRDIASTTRDFSDIIITAKPSTETFSADWLFETDKKKNTSTILNAEIFVNNEEDLRIYHIERIIGDRVEEKFYIDGNGKTGMFEFSSSKHNHYYYSSKIKEFIRGLTLSKGPRG